MVKTQRIRNFKHQKNKMDIPTKQKTEAQKFNNQIIIYNKCLFDKKRLL